MKNRIRKTRIVATIGPASESEERLRALFEAGCSVARINFSHGGYEENAEKIATIKKVRKDLQKPIALLLDTKGPEIRTGKLESGDEKVVINEGQEFTFVNEEIIGNETKASISYKELYNDVTPGAKILVDDGALEFEVQEIRGKDVVCKALNTARLGSRKTVNVPGLKLNLPALSEKDIADLTNGVKANFDYIAASFVRRADDVMQIRKLLDDNGGNDIKIISKIESEEGIRNFEEILALSDGIMVARGDMGVEIPAEQVPVVQKRFIKRCNEVGKPVITATQMLESMMQNPKPTRAEVSDVANAVYDRTTAIMLSGECALGKYPVVCVETMDRISKTIEQDVNYWKRFNSKCVVDVNEDIEFNIATSTCITAENIEANAIIAYVNKPEFAFKLASRGPECPIFVVTDSEKTFHTLGLAWDVTPILVNSEKGAIKEGIEILKQKGILEKGNTVVVAGKKDDNEVVVSTVMKID